MEVDPRQLFYSINTEPEDFDDNNISATDSISSQHFDTSRQCKITPTQRCKSEPEDINDITPDLPLLVSNEDALAHCKSEKEDDDEFRSYNPCIIRSSPELQYLNYPGTTVVLPRHIKTEPTNHPNDFKSEVLSPCKIPMVPSLSCLDTITNLPQISKIHTQDVNSHDQQNYSDGLTSLAPTPSSSSLDPNYIKISCMTELSVQCKREPEPEQQTDSLLNSNVKKLRLKSLTSLVPPISSTESENCDDNILIPHHSDMNMPTDVLKTASKEQENLKSIVKVKEEITETEEVQYPKSKLMPCFVELTRLKTDDIAKWASKEVNNLDKTGSRRKKKSNYVTKKGTKKDWYIPACEKCEAQFKNHSLLNRHRETVHGDKVLFCYTCFMYFKSHNKWKIHVKYLHAIKSIECDLCKKLFKNFFALKTHIKKYHNTSIIKVCKVFKKEEKIEENKLKIKMFKCKRCCREFLSEGTLGKHIRLYKDDDCVNKCDVCSLKFRNKYQLTRHKTIHSNNRPFACDKCNKRYKTNYKLLFHYKSHNKLLSFQCDVCSKKFKVKDFLKQHITKVHLQLKS